MARYTDLDGLKAEVSQYLEYCLRDGLIKREAAEGVMMRFYHVPTVEAEHLQQWIPASEPHEEYRDECGELIPFLCCVDDTEYPFRAVYDGKTWGDGWSAVPVAHWMPLPEPFRKEGETCPLNP